MKERGQDNIFSWREEWKTLNIGGSDVRAERVEWYYREKLVPAWRDVVMEAERARLRGEHGEVNSLSQTWMSRGLDRDIVKARVRLERYQEQMEEPYGWLVVGILGLARIVHVDNNSKVKEGEEWQRVWGGELFGDLDRVWQLVPPEEAPSKTIHGGAIDWMVEIAQDKVRTRELVGQREEGVREARRVIEERTRALKEWEEQVERELPEEGLTGEKDKARREYVGRLSGLGVLMIRVGLMDGDDEMLRAGWGLVKRAFDEEPNVERLVTVSVWCGLQALKPERRKGERWGRLGLIKDSLMGVGIGLRRQPILTMRILASEAKKRLR